MVLWATFGASAILLIMIIFRLPEWRKACSSGRCSREPACVALRGHPQAQHPDRAAGDGSRTPHRRLHSGPSPLFAAIGSISTAANMPHLVLSGRRFRGLGGGKAPRRRVHSRKSEAMTGIAVLAMFLAGWIPCGHAGASSRPAGHQPDIRGVWPYALLSERS